MEIEFLRNKISIEKRYWLWWSLFRECYISKERNVAMTGQVDYTANCKCLRKCFTMFPFLLACGCEPYSVFGLLSLPIYLVELSLNLFILLSWSLFCNPVWVGFFEVDKHTVQLFQPNAYLLKEKECINGIEGLIWLKPWTVYLSLVLSRME